MDGLNKSLAEEETLETLTRNFHRKTYKQTVAIDLNLVFDVSFSTTLKKENQKYLFNRYTLLLESALKYKVVNHVTDTGRTYLWTKGDKMTPGDRQFSFESRRRCRSD